jgi:hypothetical protein
MLDCNCPSCGSQNPVSNRHCGNCGRSLSNVFECKNCRHINLGESVHCENCGRALGQAATRAISDLQPTPRQIPPSTGTVETSPRKPRNPLLVLFAMVLACGTFSGIYAVFRANQTVAVVSGQNLSKLDVETGMRETREILEQYPDKLRTDIQPSNPISEAFLQFVDGIDSDERELEQAIAGVDVESLLGKSLASNSGRKEAKAGVERISAAVRKCTQSELSRLSVFSNSFTKPQMPESAVSTYRSTMQELLSVYADANSYRLKIIEFAEKAKPSYSNGQLLFRRSEDVKSFNALINEYNVKFVAMQTTVKSNEVSQNSAMSQMLNLFNRQD